MHNRKVWRGGSSSHPDKEAIFDIYLDRASDHKFGASDLFKAFEAEYGVGRLNERTVRNYFREFKVRLDRAEGRLDIPQWAARKDDLDFEISELSHMRLTNTFSLVFIGSGIRSDEAEWARRLQTSTRALDPIVSWALTREVAYRTAVEDQFGFGTETSVSEIWDLLTFKPWLPGRRRIWRKAVSCMVAVEPTMSVLEQEPFVDNEKLRQFVRLSIVSPPTVVSRIMGQEFSWMHFLYKEMDSSLPEVIDR